MNKDIAILKKALYYSVMELLNNVKETQIHENVKHVLFLRSTCIFTHRLAIVDAADTVLLYLVQCL